MKGSIKISIAVGVGALSTVGGIVALSDWRPFVGDASRQALERRINDLESKLLQLPKVIHIGNGGA